MTDAKDEKMTDDTTDNTAEITPEATSEITPEATAELAPEAPAEPPPETVDQPSAAWPMAQPEPAARRGPSVPTVVWGLIFALIAGGVIAAQTSDTDLNLDVTAPTALLVAGVVLVLWGIAGLGRSRLRR
jgi:hypothetical protein